MLITLDRLLINLNFLCFSHGGKGEKPVDLVLSCVDNFEARMAINTVRTPFCCLFFLFQCNLSGEARIFIIIERFSIAFMANGKRQAEIFSLMKNNKAFLV